MHKRAGPGRQAGGRRAARQRQIGPSVLSQLGVLSQPLPAAINVAKMKHPPPRVSLPLLFLFFFTPVFPASSAVIDGFLCPTPPHPPAPVALTTQAPLGSLRACGDGRTGRVCALCSGPSARTRGRTGWAAGRVPLGPPGVKTEKSRRASPCASPPAPLLCAWRVWPCDTRSRL